MHELTHGYSGDKVEVINSRSQCYINKIFSSKARGILCAEKQASFETISNSLITLKSVPILSTTLSDDSFCIKMPFMSGLSGINLLTCGSIQLAKEISTLSNMYLARLSARSHKKNLSKSVLEQKIASISESASLKYHKLINIFMAVVNSFPAEICYPNSECHGDLTLSNMIACGDTIFLLDFSPSTFDSLLSDIVKIEQDLIFGWSARFCTKYIQADAKIFAKHAYPSLGRDLVGNYKNAYFIISVLNWFRIVPYINDECTDILVESTLVKLLSE